MVPVDFESLESLDVLVMNPYETVAPEPWRLLQFVEAGGGLIVSGVLVVGHCNPVCPWGKIIPLLGCHSDWGSMDSTIDVSAGLVISTELPTALQHAVYALDALSKA